MPMVQSCTSADSIYNIGVKQVIVARVKMRLYGSVCHGVSQLYHPVRSMRDLHSLGHGTSALGV